MGPGGRHARGSVSGAEGNPAKDIHEPVGSGVGRTGQDTTTCSTISPARSSGASCRVPNTTRWLPGTLERRGELASILRDRAARSEGSSAPVATEARPNAPRAPGAGPGPACRHFRRPGAAGVADSPIVLARRDPRAPRDRGGFLDGVFRCPARRHRDRAVRDICVAELLAVAQARGAARGHGGILCRRRIRADQTRTSRGWGRACGRRLGDAALRRLDRDPIARRAPGPLPWAIVLLSCSLVYWLTELRIAGGWFGAIGAAAQIGWWWLLGSALHWQPYWVTAGVAVVAVGWELASSRTDSGGPLGTLARVLRYGSVAVVTIATLGMLISVAVAQTHGPTFGPVAAAIICALCFTFVIERVVRATPGLTALGHAPVFLALVALWGARAVLGRRRDKLLADPDGMRCSPCWP